MDKTLSIIVVEIIEILCGEFFQHALTKKSKFKNNAPKYKKIQKYEKIQKIIKHFLLMSSQMEFHGR